MRFTVCEQTTPAIRPLIDQHFVPWYSNVDQSSEWWAYAEGLGSFFLPLIAIIDPAKPLIYLDRSTGVQDADVFYARLSQYVPVTPPAPPSPPAQSAEKALPAIYQLLLLH